MKHQEMLSDRRWYRLIGLTVFALASLLMTADFHSIDEVAMFVTATNVVDRGEFHANQIGHALWGLRPGEEVVSFGNDGNVFAKKSPLMTMLLTLAVGFGRWLPQLTVRRAALWLGPLLATAVALLLFRTGRQLAYSRPVSVTLVILLTLGTMLLPYAQTIFGELLACAGIALSLLSLVRLRERNSPWLALGAGGGIAVACGVNAIYFILAALVLLIVLSWSRPLRSVFEHGVYFSAPILLMAIMLLAYNYLRFGSIWETGYQFAPGQEGFTTPLWWGAAGLMVSPARGLIWYCPGVLFSLFSWPAYHRRHRQLSGLIATIGLFHLVIFGLWWEWWGGYGWGPRFLLPTVPPILLLALPGIERALTGSQRWALALAGLSLVGLVVQIAGATIDPNQYEQLLDAQRPALEEGALRYHHDQELVYDVLASPIVYHWQKIVSADTHTQLGWWARVEPDESAIVASMTSQQHQGDIIVLLDAGLQDQFLESAANLPPVFGLPVNVDPEDERANALWARALRDAQRIWLVTWYPPVSEANWYELELREMWASESEMWRDGRRVLLFARPLAAGNPSKTAASFGPISLDSYWLAAEDGRVYVELTWSATDSIELDYVFFTHLVNEDGQIIAQQDRQPLGGYLPTSRWEVGQPVAERLAFTVTEDTSIPFLAVRVGWYRWPDLSRLPVQAENETVVEDSLVLREVGNGSR